MKVSDSIVRRTQNQIQMLRILKNAGVDLQDDIMCIHLLYVAVSQLAELQGRTVDDVIPDLKERFLMMEDRPYKSEKEADDA